jgi:hypothetical protein
MAQVDSEAIAEIDYEPGSSTLLVRFADGDWYRYFGVPVSLYADFVSAESHGRFFHAKIRDRYFYLRGR